MATAMAVAKRGDQAATTVMTTASGGGGSGLFKYSIITKPAVAKALHGQRFSLPQ